MRYLIALAVGYLVWRLFWAYVYHSHRCGWCKGSGNAYENARKKNWRPCRHCDGTGRRRRAGRWWIDTMRGKR